MGDNAMIEVDCRKCKNLGNDECTIYGKDADKAVDLCAKDGFKNYDVDWYWNSEDSEEIICPYCGEVYEPSYEDTYIGDECVDCYTEDTEEYVCDVCKRKFKMYGYQSTWKYCTETIDGQMTEKEYEDGVWNG